METKPPPVRADPRIAYIPDIHGHAKGEHKAFAEERPIPYTARMLFLWFFHACRRSSPRFLMVADHMNYLTFEDPAAVNLVRRALKLAQAGDLYGAAETAGVELGHAAVVSEGLKRGMRYSIGAEIDNDPRCRPDAQNIVDAMKPDGMIRSIHFLPIAHPQHGENWMWAFDNPEFSDLYDVVGAANVWEIYMATLLDAIEKLPGNIVGHFYVPAKFGHWPEDDVLEGYEDRFVAACAERGMAIELNSRYFYKYYVGDDAQLARYRSAHLRLLRKAKAANVMIAVGSDAHSPKDQGNAFETVLAVLDEADINEIAFPIAGRLARVALRATEEVMRQHTAALTPRVVERAPTAKVEPTLDVAAVPETVTEAAAPVAAPDETLEAAPSASKPSRSRAKTLVAEPVSNSDADAIENPDRAVATEPHAKKRSHKKMTAKNPAVEAVEKIADVVTAVAAKAFEVVASTWSSEQHSGDPIEEPATLPIEPASEPVAKSAASPETGRTAETRPEQIPDAKPVTKRPATPEAQPIVPPHGAAPTKKTARATTAERATAPTGRSTAPSRGTAVKSTPKHPPAAPPKASSKTSTSKTATQAAVKTAPTKTRAKPAKAGVKSAVKAPSKPVAKPTRSKTTSPKAAAKKSATKPAARATPAKKASAKPVARMTKKAPAKRAAPAKKPTAKAAKRSAPAKPSAAKKSATKKSAAKKKSSRARR